MPTHKRNSTEIKDTDGRKNNGMKKGTVKKNPKKRTEMVRATTSTLNKAKKDRISIYALNAMNKAFGSEEEAWESLAEQAKTSFAHLNLLWQYKYGKPVERETGFGGNKKIAPVINFYNTTAPQIENVVDITNYSEEEEEE